MNKKKQMQIKIRYQIEITKWDHSKNSDDCAVAILVDSQTLSHLTLERIEENMPCVWIECSPFKMDAT